MLWLFIKLFEVETAHVFKEIVTCIYFGRLEIFKLESFKFSQLLMTQIKDILPSILTLKILFLNLSPNERADLFIRDHCIIIQMSDKNEVDVIIDNIKNFKGIT